jgi:hypothetical protein
MHENRRLSPRPSAAGVEPGAKFRALHAFARVPNWPDPTIDSRGRPVFAVSISKDGFNPYSAPIWAKTNECSNMMPDLPGAPFQVSP